MVPKRTSSPSETISAAPGVGKIYPHQGAKVQRFLMRATRNHVYYVDRDRDVLVVAVASKELPNSSCLWCRLVLRRALELSSSLDRRAALWSD
jgi:hypothetical protein